MWLVAVSGEQTPVKHRLLQLTAELDWNLCAAVAGDSSPLLSDQRCPSSQGCKYVGAALGRHGEAMPRSPPSQQSRVLPTANQRCPVLLQRGLPSLESGDWWVVEELPVWLQVAKPSDSGKPNFTLLSKSLANACVFCVPRIHVRLGTPGPKNKQKNEAKLLALRSVSCVPTTLVTTARSAFN